MTYRIPLSGHLLVQELFQPIDFMVVLDGQHHRSTRLDLSNQFKTASVRTLNGAHTIPDCELQQNVQRIAPG